MKPVPVAFHIGPLVVHTYGIGLAITFWFAYRYFERRLRARGYPTDWVLSLFIWATIAAIVGARAMHVLANLSYYQSDPVQVFAVWHGGLSSWGGLVLAVPTGLIVSRRRCPQLRLGAALDLVAPVLAAAWAMGRLLGPQLMVAGGGHPTHQWFGMYYAGQVGRRLPVPLFQSAEDFAIFCVLLYVERRLRRAASARTDSDVARADADAEAGAIASTPRHLPPSGAVIGTAMVLWGIERVVDEKLWLAYPGHLGAVLVEAAGVALAAGGVIVLVVARQRWLSWASAVVVPEDAGPRGAQSGAEGGAEGGTGGGAEGGADPRDRTEDPALLPPATSPRALR